ncbi:hypothetical protein AHAS_Ahas16G0186700 [Arachis hypogaea]
MYDSKITLSQLENVHCHVEWYFVRFHNLLGPANRRALCVCEIPGMDWIYVLAILRYKDQFKEAVFLAFDSPSWKDLKSFSSFIMAILSSSHHESLKAQKAINETKTTILVCGLGFSDLVSHIGSMSFDSTGLHWRYNLMANRVLLLLALASRNHPNSSTRILSETAGLPLFEEFEKSTSSDKDTCNFGFEYTLKKSPYKLSPGEKFAVLEDLQGNAKSSLEEALTHTFNG